MADDNSHIRLAGNDPTDLRPRPPFSPLVMDFLAALSSALRTNSDARAMGDVQSFSFWCRRSNLERMRQDHDSERLRLGRGLLFHVAPANVPVNFAFSFAFGLLTGNANIVRVPSKPSPTVLVIVEAVDSLLREARFAELAQSQTLVSYPSDSTWSAHYSERADGRLIWGGDRTVAALRALPTPPRCVDVAFADRTSVCVMDAAAVAALPAEELARLVKGFYNDTYLMDQNACSSPHLVLWIGESADGVRRFWRALATYVAKNYDIAPVQAVDKYSDLLSAILSDEPITRADIQGSGLMVADLQSLPTDLADRRGRFGLFRQMTADEPSPLAPHLGPRFQTLTYFGVAPRALGEFVIDRRLRGIDRIVPVGQALDIGLVWDGFDIISELTRVIDLR